MYKIILICLSVFSIIGCDYRKSSSSIAATGKVGELVIVADKILLDSPLKDSLNKYLLSFTSPYLPDVQNFELFFKTQREFESGNKKTRNVLLVKIDPNYKGNEASIKKSTKLYANNQTMIELVAASSSQLLEACKKFEQELLPIFDYGEWKRLFDANAENENKGIANQLKTNFGIKLDLPVNSTVQTHRQNFYRIDFPIEAKAMETKGTQGITTVEQAGLMIFQYPANGNKIFNFTEVLKARDTMLRYNVPHEIDGLYMTTQYSKSVFPETNVFSNFDNSLSGDEVRGMWKFTNVNKEDYTGGCFWEVYFYNENTDKIVCVSGYLDAPSTVSWIFQLRRIQAVLKSVRLSK